MQSWMLENHVCVICNYEIVVTQGMVSDYLYYCSNPDCPNHIPEDCDDMEECSFATVKVNKNKLDALVERVRKSLRISLGREPTEQELLAKLPALYNCNLPKGWRD